MTQPHHVDAEIEPADHPKRPSGLSARTRNAMVFAGVALVWFVFDVLTKRFFNAYAVGEHIAGPFANVFQFTLVHNTGAAWGMFGGSTFALGMFALVVCAVLMAYLFLFEPRAHWSCAVGVGMVVAGGVGNALDRFTLGYVVDFIEPVFIDFPVFNIADIGVTCGVVLVLVSMLVALRKDEQEGR